MNIVYFDTETTNFIDKVDSEARILIQVAAVVFSDSGRIVKFDVMCRPPEEEICVASMVAHNITPEMIEDQPDFKTMKEYKLLEQVFSSDCVAIAHNAKFDVEVLRKEGIDMSGVQIIDTLKVARLINDKLGLPWESCSLPYLKYQFRLDKKLGALKEKLGIEKELSAHDAMSDILDLFLLTQYFKEEYDCTLEDMITVSENPIYYSYVPSGKNRGKKFSELSFNQLQWHAENDYDENVRYTCSKIIGNI